MDLIENVIEVKDYLTKSNLPASDFVINPYVGCPHACKYCLTRKILEQLISIDCELGISTKSKLILRDIDLLKQCKNLKVSMSINTLDEDFKNDMDNASNIADRLNTLKELHDQGIYTILFMSPIFPEITDFRVIIEESHTFIDEYWFENLNLRGGYKQTILSYIEEKYPQLNHLYQSIFVRGSKDYWVDLSCQIEDYCKEKNLNYRNYFYHKELVAAKSAIAKISAPALL